MGVDNMVEAILVWIGLFLISWLVSAVVIYVAAKLLKQREGFSTALAAALIGTIIYAVANYLLGGGIWASIIGGLAWLFALRSLYKVGWLMSALIALIIWIFSAIASWFLPTLL